MTTKKSADKGDGDSGGRDEQSPRTCTVSGPRDRPDGVRTDRGRHGDGGLGRAVGARRCIASSSEPAATFPTEDFADIGEDPVSRNVAAQFKAALREMAGDGGMAATMMSPDGMWSGAVGKGRPLFSSLLRVLAYTSFLF